MEEGASMLTELLADTGEVVTKFGTMIADVFDNAVSNPVCLLTIGISVTFAALAGVRKLVRSLKGVK